MHMTRPKSSKGRSRPALNHSKTTEIGAYGDSPITPQPPRERGTRSAHSSAPPRRSSASHAQDTTTVALQRDEVPAPHTLCLNRYRVLPSIERRVSSTPECSRTLEEKISQLNLADEPAGISNRREQLCLFRTQAASRSNPEMGGTRKSPGFKTPEPPNSRAKTAPRATEGETLGTGPSSEQQHGLLLAVRSPSGKRFQRHFLPTDTLHAVLAAAEEVSGTRYERGVIQTMEVPRRSFVDLTMTLAQCGILNRSVLCITREDGDVPDST